MSTSSETPAAAAATVAHRCCFMCQAVSLRNNLLTGPATQFGDCRLTALDISYNYFTGVLPVPRNRNSTNWDRLQVYRVNNNNFAGRLPQFAYGEAPVLAVLVLGNNSLTGTRLTKLRLAGCCCCSSSSSVSEEPNHYVVAYLCLT
jgi:hypothetical protein